VKILDFGISKFNAPELTSATITGAVLGSPVYMAPEQARGLKHVDARTDLYSVGVLLFEAVTGRVPFMGENFNDLMFKIALAPRPNPLHLRPDLDPAMAAILVKAIAADPKERFPSSGAFHTALTDWLCAQGVTSVAAPELRHALNTTPRLSGSRKSSPQHSEPWSDATMPSEIVAGTPLAASSTLGDQSPRKKHAAMIGALLAGMVLVGLVGGLAAVRRVKAPVQTATAAAPPEPSIATETPPPAVEKTVAPATAEATLTPAVTLTESAALAPPSNAPAAAHHPPPGAGASRPQPRTSKSATAGASSTPPSEPSQRVESATAPPSAAPPASAPKRVDSVEGREFRTGL
jgi:eukaryotic-like serine/threonine-protein kinase